MSRPSTQKITLAALLIAIGIAIPTFSPLKLVLEPASFTLASHVPLFIAMFVSLPVAVAVALGTTLGFFLGGFPLVIVLRAASHIVFVLLGCPYLRRRPRALLGRDGGQAFSFALGLVHGAAELCVAAAFYFSGGMAGGYYAKGFALSVLVLVGLGSVVHSMVDFAIAQTLLRALGAHKALRPLFSVDVR
ncbi:MAG: hypothetical protein LBU67_01350 [Oscillospiraceae bacterium]|jgi:niacin transporter|nr:hypothetical protein [Oscillospiraceae bacterium]